MLLRTTHPRVPYANALRRAGPDLIVDAHHCRDARLVRLPEDLRRPRLQLLSIQTYSHSVRTHAATSNEGSTNLLVDGEYKAIGTDPNQSCGQLFSQNDF